MPVKVKKIKGKYRIVGPDDEIEKTDSGAARDGGGHSDPGKAHAQAAHINKKSGKKKSRRKRKSERSR